MPLRLAYLGVSNAFALLRLMSMSDRGKDAEILALRHQLAVLQRQISPQRVRFTSIDRALINDELYKLVDPQNRAAVIGWGNDAQHLSLRRRDGPTPRWLQLLRGRPDSTIGHGVRDHDCLAG